MVLLAVQYDLCVTGDGLRHCMLAGIDDVVIAVTQVRRLRPAALSPHRLGLAL